MGDLTKHFSLHEFACDGQIPPKTFHPNIRALCERLLQPIREAAGGPIKVVSGWRSKKHNDALPGKVAEDSYHLYGWAADIRWLGHKTEELHALVIRLRQEGKIPPCGIGLYPGRRNLFVHVDLGPSRDWTIE